MLVLAASAAAAPGSAIVVRHDVPDAAYLSAETSFDALFGIYLTKQGHNNCIGTVIDPRWAVTAAHCAQGKALITGAAPGGQGYPVQVAGQRVLIDKVVPHPGSGDGPPPDLALLRFAAPVTHVDPVPIYRRGDEQGRIILMPGWGRTGNGQAGLGAEDGLFRIAENVVDRVEPGRIWWTFDAPGPNSRALTLEGISGPGDSGGPALIRRGQGWAVAGISSGQNTKGGPEGLYGVEEVFVRASAFAAWIDGHVASTGRPPR